MKKTLLILLSIILFSGSVYAAVGKETKGPFGYNLYDDITRKPDDNTSDNNKEDTTEKEFYGDATEAEWEISMSFYPDADLNSAVKKYKEGNYSGCLQEMISLVQIDPSNPIVYYYMGMSYTKVGKKDQAVKAYEQVIKLQPDKVLVQYATKGRDCLVNGPTCSGEDQQNSDPTLDKFIKSPYGNGFSEELNKQVKQKQLENIQKTINYKQELEEKDIKNIQKFDQKSEMPNKERLVSNKVSDDEILSAIKTLKDAGITVSINNPMPVNNQFNEYSMLLGNNNNNNNSMMNMVPFLLNQYQNGEKIDPQIIQSVMMNSMLPDFSFMDNNKNY